MHHVPHQRRAVATNTLESFDVQLGLGQRRLVLLAAVHLLPDDQLSDKHLLQSDLLGCLHTPVDLLHQPTTHLLAQRHRGGLTLLLLHLDRHHDAVRVTRHHRGTRLEEALRDALDLRNVASTDRRDALRAHTKGQLGHGGAHSTVHAIGKDLEGHLTSIVQRRITLTSCALGIHLGLSTTTHQHAHDGR